MARKPTGILKIAQEVIEHKRDFGAQYNEFCGWIVDTQIGYYNQDHGIHESDQTQILVSNMLEWLTTWPGLVKWKDGGLVKLASWSAEITMSPGTSGDAQWVVAVPALDNNAAFELAINDAIIVCDAPRSQTKYEKRPCQAFLRLEDTLVRLETHGITFSALEAICKLGKVPVEALKGTLEGQTLFRILSRGSNPAALSQWSRQIPVSAEVRLAINSDNELQINARALAQNADDSSFFWKPGPGWQPLPSDAELTAGTISLPDELRETLSSNEPGNKILRNAEALSSPEELSPSPEADKPNKKYLHTAPRQEDVQDVEQWLKVLVAVVANASISADQMGIKGSIKPSNFLPRWFQRPPDVDYFGNSDFQKLVTVRPGPKLSVKAEASGMDWLTVSVSLENEISQTSLPELSKILAADSSAYVRLPGGIYRRADLEAYQDDINYLNALGLSVQSNEQRLHALHLAGAPTDIMARMDESGASMAALAEKGRQVLSNFKGIPDAPVPAEVANYLRPYQHSGVNFLYWAALNFGGALLSDDMGLGKTLQMLAAITALRQTSNASRPGPSLVVCPASVAHNWQREAHRFVPGLKVLVLESGAGRRKHLNELSKYDLVIMNFALLRRDIDALQRTNWFIIVVDEAQAIKNAASESSRNIKQLDAKYRFALTGTPIENRIADLYSIVDFALPGYLGELDVATNSTDPQSAARAHQLLRSKLRPVLIRRMKTEVAPELPDRVETRIDCEMGTPQKKLYAAEVKRARTMLEGIQDSGLQGKHRIEMLAALMRLRQICCDPLLAGHPEISSGKTEELLELVPSLLEAGHKVLVFSQFVKMLNHLEEQLTQNQIRTYKLTGATKNRQVLVDDFENDKTPAVFLISLKAGGTGLNLVSASHVILFDPWWNPSVEAQAIDRTHRIGQDKTVVAYRLVAQGTIEERILELQERKRALVRNILEEDSFNRTLTNEDFKFLLD
jgi:superfamily II DNA or RNA helicase